MRLNALRTIAMMAADGHRVGFHPVVDIESGRTIAWEALARGTDAGLARQEIERAIAMAAAAGLTSEGALLALPLPAVDDPAGIATHLFCTALAHGLPASSLLVQLDASERSETQRVAALADACRGRGMRIALEGYVAGPQGMKLLGQIRPELLRLDTSLTHNLAIGTSRRRILTGVLRLARALGATVVAPDITSGGDLTVLQALGITHFQSEALDSRPVPRRRYPLAPVPRQLPTIHAV